MAHLPSSPNPWKDDDERVAPFRGETISDAEGGPSEPGGNTILDDPGDRGVGGDARFEVVRVLGRGGMGEVLLARDQHLGRFVALKVLLPEMAEDRRAINRFHQEARAIAALAHHHIVRIYSVELDHKPPRIEMEYVEGPHGSESPDWPAGLPKPPLTLEQWVTSRGGMPEAEAATLGLKLLGALDYAHKKGLVHRDIKPANILLDEHSDPKLVDFGLARQLAADGRTMVGARMGTPDYMAPEQEVDAAGADGRADIYGLGGCLYFCLTGESPRYFRESRLPAPWRPILLRAMERNREARHPSAQALADDLRSVTGAPSGRMPADGHACPQCGSANPPDVRFCQECGQKLEAPPLVCSSCGRENLPNVRFCGGCGTNLKEPQSVAIPPAVEREVRGMIAAVRERVGAEGGVVVEDGMTLQTEVELVDGMKFASGYLSPYFVTDQASGVAVLADSYILICDQAIASMLAILPLLEKVAQSSRPLLIISEDMDREVLATLIVNNTRGVLKNCVVKAPGFPHYRREILEDIAILTGGKVISEGEGRRLENARLEDLGRTARVRVGKDSTILVEARGRSTEIEDRKRQIMRLMEGARNVYDRERQQERLAKLAGGVGVIRVGGSTADEIKQRKSWFEKVLREEG